MIVVPILAKGREALVAVSSAKFTRPSITPQRQNRKKIGVNISINGQKTTALTTHSRLVPRPAASSPPSALLPSNQSATLTLPDLSLQQQQQQQQP